MRSPYSIPKLVKYEDLKKTWYVYFRYRTPLFPAGKIFKFTDEMNRECKTYKERVRYGEALATTLHERLKKGWNPVVPDITQGFINGADMTLYQSLEYALEKKMPSIADKTAKGYEGFLRFIKKGISDSGLNDLEIAKVERSHVRALLEIIQKDRNWSNKAYNKNLGIFQVFLNELVEWDIIKLNPARGMRSLRVEKSNPNRIPTDKEIKLIKSHLLKRDYNFWVYVQAEFYTGIRPVELLRLQISMINKETREIHLPANITKTKTYRVVPVHDFLWYQLERYLNKPDDYYFFGSSRIPGRGNEGKFNDFIPGPTQLKRDTATKRWNRLIKKELSIDVNLYAMKHYGATMLLRAGVPVDAIRHLFGHADKRMTEVYVKDIRGIYKDQLLTGMPEL